MTAPKKIEVDEILPPERRALVPAPVPMPDYDRETDEQYRQRVARRMKPRLDRFTARVPKIYEDAALDKLDAGQQPEELVTWLNGPSRTLYLVGLIGTGKTFSAYAAARHAAETLMVWVEAWNVVELLDALMPGPESTATWAAVLECDLLVLDDLAAPKVTDWASQAMYRIADKRVNEGRRQILTANGSYDALEEKWGSPTMDRFSFRSSAISLTGQSRRRQRW